MNSTCNFSMIKNIIVRLSKPYSEMGCYNLILVEAKQELVII